MPLTLRRFEDPASFSERAGPYLMLREDLNSLFLGIVQRLIDRGPYQPDAVNLLATVEEAGEIVGVVVRTPPFKLLVSDLPLEAATPVARFAHELYDAIPAVSGTRAVATAVAEAWCALTGAKQAMGMQQALHRLDHLREPPAIDGLARTAANEDAELLVTWIQAFHVDVNLPEFSVTLDDLATRLGSYVIWDVDGEPVSFAGCGAHTPKGARVGPVYTPDAHRRHGYGTAVTAAITRNLLNEGKQFVTLYTDLANPTSNKIYHSLGYRVIAEVVDVEIRERTRGSNDPAPSTEGP